MITDEIKILHSHGLQFVPDVTKVELCSLFRGRPEISGDITTKELEMVAEFCPVDAIDVQKKGIDMGKCIFCKECEFALPTKIKFTNDYKIATNQRENLFIKAGDTEPIKMNHSIIRTVVKKLFKHSLKLRQISAGGDNSNEMELNACANVNFDMGRFGIEWVASPRHADAIVITGPISENMANATRICYDATPEPKMVILVGSDAISGGIFLSSDAINRSFLNNIPIDLYVPGNPIHPLTFINGLLELTRGK